MRRIVFAAFLIVAGAFPVEAQQTPIKVETAWARASAGESKTGAAYLTLHNMGTQPDRLLSVANPVDMLGSATGATFGSLKPYKSLGTG